MTFAKAVKDLNKILKEKDPKTFSSSWIFKNTRLIYNFICLNYRTENGDIDWDILTYTLNRKFQKRWVRYRLRKVKLYENKDEVEHIKEKYKNHLYTFMTSIDEKDRLIRNRITIAFVRIAQKGNVLAEREIITWVTYVVNDWIERHWQIRRWKGYTDEIEDKIRGCIRRYRYTGSFLGYLFKTLEYSARGIAPIQKYSLNDPVFDGDETRINYVIHDQQTTI